MSRPALQGSPVMLAADFPELTEVHRDTINGLVFLDRGFWNERRNKKEGVGLEEWEEIECRLALGRLLRSHNAPAILLESLAAVIAPDSLSRTVGIISSTVCELKPKRRAAISRVLRSGRPLPALLLWLARGFEPADQAAGQAEPPAGHLRLEHRRRGRSQRLVDDAAVTSMVNDRLPRMSQRAAFAEVGRYLGRPWTTVRSTWKRGKRLLS